MSRNLSNSRLSLLYQPSLLLLGAGTILAFIALYAFPPKTGAPEQQDFRPLIWICWGILFVFILLWRGLGWYLSPKKEFEQSKEVVDLFTKITTSFLLIISISLTWLGLRDSQKATDRNLAVSQQTLEHTLINQADERFTRALEKIGSNTEWERIAGILSLERIDSEICTKHHVAIKEGNIAIQKQMEKEHWEITNLLATFIQQNAPWKENNPLQKPRGDIYHILRIIGARKLTYLKGEEDRLVLINTDLRGYKIKGNFEGVLFREAHLEKAEFIGAKLAHANFEEAHLEGAKLQNADLTSTVFRKAFLKDVDLTGAIGVKPYQLTYLVADNKR